MSVNALIWNAQGVVNPATTGTLKNWIKEHQLVFVAILEPQNTCDPSSLDHVFGLSFRLANSPNKIWIFSHRDFVVEEIKNTEQVLHVRLTAVVLRSPIYLNTVYAKCSRVCRYPLWDTLCDISFEMEGLPWLIGGDFNIFLLVKERMGSSVHRHLEMANFADAIADCQLLDPGFDGPLFTWERAGLRQRLDRILLGEHWSDSFALTRVTHLPRISSDHGALLVHCKFSGSLPRSSFRFQNMWVSHHTFLDNIGRVWEPNTGYNGMFNLQLKLGRVKQFLKSWNNDVFGNIHDKIRNAEEDVRLGQEAYDANPSPDFRSELNRSIACYILCSRMEEDFWRQKSDIRWVVDGERNTKCYQGWAKQKRIKSRIHVIKDGGRDLSSEDEIRVSAADFFQSLLTSDVGVSDFSNIDGLSSLPSSIDLHALCSSPLADEVHSAVFDISADSTHGPDGFSSIFFQHCWEIVGPDVISAAQDFFAGSHMSRSFTATSIVLLPKIPNPESWDHFRPISLCNVTNKIISKILTSRLAPLIPVVVAHNQSGFVKVASLVIMSLWRKS